ncbi:MAG: manganese efflux pump, partial [Clostridiales bacterium]|nr:manganese efflux pump [Clostridiales bacterium]
MGLLELFILAIGLSMDAFAVSICKGLALPKINLKSAGIVGLWFGAFQALMPLIGYLLGVNFRSYIVSIDHWIAFVLLALIGANMIKEALSDDDEEEEVEIRNLKRGSEEGTIGVYSLDSCSISPTGQVALSREDNGIKEILGFKTMFLLAV